MAAPDAMGGRSARRGLIDLALKALVPELPEDQLEAEADDRGMAKFYSPCSMVESLEASSQLPVSLAQVCDTQTQIVHHRASREAAPAPKRVHFAEEEVILIPSDYEEAMHRVERETRALDCGRAQEAWGPCLGPVAALAVGALHAMQRSRAEESFAS